MKKFIFMSFLLLGACATKPPISDLDTQAAVQQWEGKAQVKNLQNSKSNSISLDFVAENKSRLRMNVTGSFSTPVAAAVVSKGQMTYILPQQKKYFQGSASTKSLQNLLKVQIGVEDLFAILYDEPMPGWVCSKGAEGQWSSCGSPNGSLNVKVLERTGGNRQVKISNLAFEIDMNLERVPLKVKDLEKAFTLKVPENYQAQN